MPDDDLDAVADIKDKCRGTYGYPDNKGCPYYYFSTRKQFDAFFGMQANSAKINLPELNQLGYDDVDVLQSKKEIGRAHV